MTKHPDDVLKQFKQSRLDLLAAVKNFPTAKESRIFYGDWTIREVVGHISAWDIYFSDLLSNFSSGKQVEHWGNIFEFNKNAVTLCKNKTLKKLTDELEKSGKQFNLTYQNLPTKALEQKIFLKKKYTPKDILKIELDHYLSQIKQIEKRY